MKDTRNIILAWISSLSSVFAAIEYRDVVLIVSAVVLPVIFFSVGKTVDVLVQLHINRRKQ